MCQLNRGFMITITDAAKNHLQKMLEKKGVCAAFRLSVKKTGCSGYQYVPEIVLQKNPSDIEITEKTFLFYLDADSVSIIKGTAIDYVQKSLGISQLVFDNPNADSLCGCGESFNLKTDSGNPHDR